MNKIAAATLLLCLSPRAHADINMMEASFKTSFIDLQTESNSKGLKVSRTYDSRSTYSGLFGFGWCSNLDVSVVQSARRLSINECGKLSIADFYQDKNSYIRKKPDGVLQRFAAEDGRLTGITVPGHKEVHVLKARRRSLPQANAAEEGDNKRSKVLLELDDSGRVVRIESKGPDPALHSHPSSFRYGPEGNLLSVTNSWNNSYTYSYDRLHNLTLVSYPDRTFEKLTYDADRDTVTSFQGRNGCTENYQHSANPKLENRTSLKQTSTATLNCPGQSPTQTQFDFQYTKRADSRWALAQLRLVTADGKTKIVKYKIGGLQ